MSKKFQAILLFAGILLLLFLIILSIRKRKPVTSNLMEVINEDGSITAVDIFTGDAEWMVKLSGEIEDVLEEKDYIKTADVMIMETDIESDSKRLVISVVLKGNSLKSHKNEIFSAIIGTEKLKSYEIDYENLVIMDIKGNQLFP